MVLVQTTYDVLHDFEIHWFICECFFFYKNVTDIWNFYLLLKIDHSLKLHRNMLSAVQPKSRDGYMTASKITLILSIKQYITTSSHQLKLQRFGRKVVIWITFHCLLIKKKQKKLNIAQHWLTLRTHMHDLNDGFYYK